MFEMDVNASHNLNYIMSIKSLYPKPRKPENSRSGFTLIELLMVFTVIAILAAITFGISGGVRNAQNRSKVKVELAAITQALEEFKARYGDYPWHDSSSGSYPTSQVDPDGSEVEVDATSVMMLYALTGRMKFDPQAADPVYMVDDSLEDEEVKKAPKFLELSKFTYTVDSNGNPGALLDPWGNPYIYQYKQENKPDSWDFFGYHFLSTGPDLEQAKAAIPNLFDAADGLLTSDYRSAADAAGIIFAGE